MQPPSDNQAEQPTLPAYVDPRESRLEPFAERITQMRVKRYPYRAIAEDLSGRGIAISWQGIRKFCLARKIHKGQRTFATVAPAEAMPESSTEEVDPRKVEIAERVKARVAKKRAAKRFQYSDEEKPIRTWKDET
ncbi:MAG: hypothetical protein KDN22_28945 [Verrucomicrobiae bacterium]|nr:hypothetical protein [Verrucomicrobiae bacterium]